MDRAQQRHEVGFAAVLAVRTRSCCCGLLLIVTGAAAWGQEAAAVVSADQAISRLMEGNRRYSRHIEQHPDETPARRKELEGAQH
jgi:hypothetical protein